MRRSNAAWPSPAQRRRSALVGQHAPVRGAALHAGGHELAAGRDLHLISMPPCWLLLHGCGSCPPGPEVRGTQGERRMPTGTVKWFNPDKGFGFIQPQDGGKDVFVHITAVQAAGLQSLNENQKVTYEVVTERGKEAAANLRPA
jgi:CspA family cold shock protein